MTNRTADVVVIGGGVNGASTAFHLTEPGRQAGGAGGAASPGRGGLRQVRLSRAHALHQRARVPAGPRKPQGLSRLAEPGGRRLRLRAHRLSQAGRPRPCATGWSVTSPCSRRSASIPAWSPPRKCARSLPGSRAGGCRRRRLRGGFRLCRPQRDHLCPRRRQLGGRVPRSITHCEATRIVTERGRVVAVETAVGRIETPAVVLVPGAWAAPLLEPLGSAYPLSPFRIQVSIFRWPAGMTRRHCVISDDTHEAWIRPEGAASDPDRRGAGRLRTATRRSSPRAWTPTTWRCAARSSRRGCRPSRTRPCAAAGPG